ncbi:MAG: PTS transporter subunit EIIC, partial [Paraclostridium sp.]
MSLRLNYDRKECVSMYSVFYKIYNNTWIKSIRQGLLKVQPIILINCMLIIMLNIDYKMYNEHMTKLLSSNWKNIFQDMYNSMYMLTKILIIISISSQLAKVRINEKTSTKYIGNKLSTNIVGFVGITSAFIFDSFFNTSNSINIDANWTLISIIISIVFSEIYIKIHYYILDRKKNASSSYNRIVRQSFYAIWPATITIIILIVTTFIFKNMYLYIVNTLNNAIIYGDNGFFNDIKYIFLANAFWVIGGHGGDLIIHEVTFNRLPVDTFCNIGGSGSTMCLIIAILIYSVDKYSKKIAKISIIPSIFNINETIMYGLPILFNPIYIIPFILVPIVSYITSYIAMEYGIIEIVNTNISWIDPIISNAYKLTGSFGGIIVQVINIFIGVVIY